MYILKSYSKYDYELRNILNGVFTTLELANESKKVLEDKQEDDEFIFYVEKIEINKIIEGNE